MAWKLISGTNLMEPQTNMFWLNMALIMGYGRALLVYLASLFSGGSSHFLYSECSFEILIEKYKFQI